MNDMASPPEEFKSPKPALDQPMVTWLFWILNSLAMLPILALHNIPFSDYSNHLARVSLRLRDEDSKLFPTLYQQNLHFRPYLGFDLPAWLLGHVIGLELVGKLFLLGTLTLWNFGLFRLSRSLGNFGIGACVAVLLTYNMQTIQGFLPFMMGLALVPWYLIAFTKSEPDAKTKIALAVFPVVLFACHQFALLLFVVGGICCLFDPQSTPKQRKLQITQLILLLAANFIYVVTSRFGSVSKSIEFGSVGQKIHNFTEAFITGSLKLDLAYLTILVLFVGILVAKKVLTVPRVGWTLMAFCGLLFLIFPLKLGLAENIDYRFLLFGSSLFLTVLRPTFTAQSMVKAIAGILIVMATFRSFYVWRSFLAGDIRIAEARPIMRELPGTPAIIVGTIGTHSQWEPSQWKPMSYSVAPFAVIDRPAYVNTLFQEPSMMTIKFGDLGRALDYVGRRNGAATPEQIQSLLTEAKDKVAKIPKNLRQDFAFYMIIVSTDLERLPETPVAIQRGTYFSIYSIPNP